MLFENRVKLVEGARRKHTIRDAGYILAGEYADASNLRQKTSIVMVCTRNENVSDNPNLGHFDKCVKQCQACLLTLSSKCVIEQITSIQKSWVF